MTEVNPIARRRSGFQEALDEFAPEHRDAILAFAHPDMWWRRLTTRLNPALALQLAIDPDLKDARRMLDQFDSVWTTDDIAEAAGLVIPHDTRPAQLRVVGCKVLLADETKETEVECCSL